MKSSRMILTFLLIAVSFLTIIPGGNSTAVSATGPVATEGYAQLESIPGLTCFRTVEETYASAAVIAAAHPNLAEWIDVGDSWEKVNTGGLSGYDLMVLKLTNSAIPGPKPILLITGATHGDELTTTELVMRFGEYLVNNYGVDADATWLLDYHEVHLMMFVNPDGHKKAETGLGGEKNTDNNYCTGTDNRGVNLNRNFSFQWGQWEGGSSSSECNEYYRGPTAASEPETQAVQSYMRAIFPDQRTDPLTSAAAPDSTGIYIDIHRYYGIVLWPWGFTSTVAPNGIALQTLGRKLAYFNGYEPVQMAAGRQILDGSAFDFAYGDLGVASYILELGGELLESCSSFENADYPKNLPALIYAAKVARTPYLTPRGPDALNLEMSPARVASGDPTTLTAIINDTRYNTSSGTEATQTISAAEYYIDLPPWQTGAVAQPMNPSDGSFDSQIEGVTTTVLTSSLSAGKHILFVRGMDANNNWGAFSAIFLTVEPSANWNIFLPFIQN